MPSPRCVQDTSTKRHPIQTQNETNRKPKHQWHTTATQENTKQRTPINEEPILRISCAIPFQLNPKSTYISYPHLPRFFTTPVPRTPTPYATILFNPPKNPLIPPLSSFFFRPLRSVSLLLGLILSSPAPAALLLLGRSDSVRRLTGLSFSVTDMRRDLGRSRSRSRARASDPGEMMETRRLVRRSWS